jgi:nucleotide-binding universal stress UspA family protein
MDLRRIVVGLELGKLSDQAVVRAMALARDFGARLDIVHGAGIVGPVHGSRRQAFATQHGEAALERAREVARGKLELSVEDPAFAGRPLDEYLHVSPLSGSQALLAFAREHGADLLVLGSHRRRRLLDLGGTARGVLAHSTCPVWMEPAEAHRFERVLAAVDLSPVSARALATARALAARFVVPVRVLHVFVPPAFAYDPLGGDALRARAVSALREEEQAEARELVARLDWGALPLETLHDEGEPAERIVARAGPADLTVMGTHGHGPIARALLGSCAERVLRSAQGPVLVLPEHARPS